MTSPPIQELLRADEARFDAFVKDVAEAAKQAGYPVGARKEYTLMINHQGYNLEYFFPRRNIPNAMPRLMTWFQDQKEGRNPNHRPGNFMAD